jgi:hypothetical protein
MLSGIKMSGLLQIESSAFRSSTLPSASKSWGGRPVLEVLVKPWDVYRDRKQQGLLRPAVSEGDRGSPWQPPLQYIAFGIRSSLGQMWPAN